MFPSPPTTQNYTHIMPFFGQKKTFAFEVLYNNKNKYYFYAS